MKIHLCIPFSSTCAYGWHWVYRNDEKSEKKHIPTQANNVRIQDEKLLKKDNNFRQFSFWHLFFVMRRYFDDDA